ncbi:MAG: lipocalin family protein [Rhodobacteraceae bacterium]|nr:lipocalin family protein [Paracoccaceae bacterium]
MRALTAALPLLVAAALAGCAAVAPSYRDARVPMTSIAALDAARYAGRWHEVARYPVPFQAGCGPATADYTLLADGSLGIVNACPTASGGRRIEGRAVPAGPGRFEVSFRGLPFRGPYWVLWVDEGYRTAVVGVPSGRAGWILNREPTIPPDRLRAAMAILEWNGYDLSRLQVFAGAAAR